MAHSLLLADDSPTIARILTMALPAEEYAITAVQTAADAMQKLAELQPVFFLIDVDLPEKGGLDFTHHVKTTPGLESTKVIILANAFDPVDEGAYANAGVDAVVVKPFDPAELRGRLATLALEAPKQAPGGGLPPPTPAYVDEPTLGNELTANTADDLLAPAADFITPAALGTAAVDVPPNTLEAHSPTGESLADLLPSAPPPGKTPPPVQERTLTHEIDLNTALSDWAKSSPAATAVNEADLSQWSSPDMNEGVFDVGGSTFEFSPDYVERVTKAFLGIAQEETAKKFGVVLSSDRAPRPMANPLDGDEGDAPAAAVADPARTPSPSAPRAQPQPVAQPTFAAPSVSREEIEVVVRDEVRTIVHELFPAIAEKIIREELEKILHSLDPNSPQ